MPLTDAAPSPPATASGRDRWTAIVLAGQRPGVDALARAFGGTVKAEIPILGRPMLARVVETLLATPAIERVVVLAQRPEALESEAFLALRADPRVRLQAGGNGISASIQAVAGTEAAPWPVFVTTADHPLLTPEIVTSFLEGVGDADLAVGMVESATLLAVYPDARRTWLRFADGAFTGANLFALRSDRTVPALRLWSAAEADRKQAFKLFLHFGPLLALRAITRTIGLRHAIAKVGRRMGMDARLVALDHPDAAIDVDKLSDHRQAEAILRRREGLPPPARVSENEGDRALTGVSVFDLDRTLTRLPTYTALLVHGALQIAPVRLLNAPLVVGAMLAHVAGLLSRRRVKEIEQHLLLGRSVARADVERLAADFADRLDRDGLLAEGKARILAERAEGRRVLLATAANRFYAEALAERLAIDEVVATDSAWADGRLLARIDGENCYGPAKREMVERYFEAQGLKRADLHIRFFSDHISDRPTFEWADEPIAVNPSRKLRRLAADRGWPVLDWR